MEPRFPLVTLRAAAMALVLARRAYRGERTAHLARVVRYCRARGLRGASSSSRVRCMAAAVGESFNLTERD